MFDEVRSPVVGQGSEVSSKSRYTGAGQPITDIVEFSVESSNRPAEPVSGGAIGRQVRNGVAVEKGSFGEGEDQPALIVGHWKIGKADRLLAFGITGRRAWIGLSEQYLEFVVEASSRELDGNREGERHFPAGCQLDLRSAREVLDDKWDSAASVAEPPDTVAELDTAEVPMEERVVVEHQVAGPTEANGLIGSEGDLFAAEVDQAH